MSEFETSRTTILKAAYKLLHENGLPSLSYSAIAEAGGVSRQLVRYYFKQPDDLMYALCDQLADQFRKRILAGVDDLEGRSRLEYMLDFFFNMIEGKRKLNNDQVYDAMFSLAAGSPGLKENLRGQYTLLGEVARHEISAEYPEMSQQSCEELAFLFVCLMYGHWKMVASLGFHEDHNAISRAAMDRLLASYRIQGAAEPAVGKVWKAVG